jgi:hypothetical protein
MKKLYTLALALCATSLSFAQISYDLQLDLVTPASGSTVPGTAAVSVNFTVTNNGPDAVPMGDTLFFVYTNAVGSQVYSFVNVLGQASGFILAAPLANGSSLSATDLGGPFSFDLSAFPNGETCNVVCLGSGSVVLAGTGDPNDTNPVNNFDSFIVNQTSGLAELNAGIVVYPNPAINALNVEASEAIASITVIGMDGSIVSNSEFSSQVDVSTLVSGIYVYQVTLSSGAVVTNKFVKQ